MTVPPTHTCPSSLPKPFATVLSRLSRVSDARVVLSAKLSGHNEQFPKGGVGRFAPEGGGTNLTSPMTVIYRVKGRYVIRKVGPDRVISSSRLMPFEIGTKNWGDRKFIGFNEFNKSERGGGSSGFDL